MGSEKQTPIGDELKEKILRGLWLRFTRRSFLSQIFLVLIVVVIVFALARLQLMGESALRATRILVPWELGWLDPHRAAIPLRLSYEIEDMFGRRPGRQGNSVRSGDTVTLTFQADTQAWLTVFGVDLQGVHPIFGEGLEPLLIEPGKAYAREFKLDDTLGPEIYYAVAGSKTFDFTSAVEPYLPSLQPDPGARGPAESPLDLNPARGFTVKRIWFQHVAGSH